MFCFATVSMMAQGVSVSYKKETIAHLEMLLEEGRKSYVEVGNKAQVKRIIDAYEAAISQSDKEGILSQRDKDSLLLFVKCYKLYGDYHYLNSDEDPRSFALAEKCFKEASAFVEDPGHETWGKDVFYYRFVMREELAQLYYKQGRFTEAYVEMKEAEKWMHAALSSENDILDFVSQLAMCKARIGQFKEALNDIDLVINSYPDKKGEPYGEALRKKAKILMLQQESDDTGMANPTDEALKCYKEYFAMKKADAMQRLGEMSPENREQYWMRIRPFIVDCYRTETADPAFLYDVTLFGKSLLLEYAHSGKPQSFNWKQVQKKLQSNDCAVEFIQYEKYGKKQMGALVLKKKGEPQFVRISSVEGLENLSLTDGDYLYDAVTTDCPDMKNELYNDSTNFSLIWTPELLTAIGKETQRLFFAADGLFHELAIEYMLPKLPALTSLKTENLYRLTSTRQLLVEPSKKRSRKVLLCGGIDFFKASQTADDGNEAQFTNDEQAYWHLKSMEFRFGNLPGTKTEIEGIRNEYDSSLIVFLTDTLATETRVACMIGQYPIVHMATHGFYLGETPEGTDLLPASYDESLSQSGIVFAGTTSALYRSDFDATQHDGILSAREIVQMDFSGVDLIVLSACQTAQGYMTDDGIYGLQRSLKNAGVKTMILSLWSVDDDATSLLMQAFYKYLKTEDIHTAFLHAREELINSYREPAEQFDPSLLVTELTEPNYGLPEYYNAFILIDVK